MKYTFKEQEGAARASVQSLSISTKASVEICNFLRKKPLNKAISILERVVVKKQAIPYKRFTDGAGHKPGIGPGKYPIKAGQAFIALLKEAQSNASDKGLSEHLLIESILAQKGTSMWKYGRQRRRKAKRTHLQIQVIEYQPKTNRVEVKKQTEDKKLKAVEVSSNEVSDVQNSENSGDKQETQKSEKKEPVKEETKKKISETKVSDDAKESKVSDKSESKARDKTTEPEGSELSEAKSSDHNQKPKVSDTQAELEKTEEKSTEDKK